MNTGRMRAPWPDEHAALTSSFSELLRSTAGTPTPLVAVAETAAIGAPVATTIVAARCADGVVMAGDRRATMGTAIASRDIEKVFPADDFSAIGVAGTAGVGVELVRLFQWELEHYEKIEGAPLSLPGKANRLASLLRGNLSMAMQGLQVIALFAGFDQDTTQGRIYSYDITGGRYEEHEYHAVGSGAVYAKGSLKKRWHPGDNVRRTVETVVEALMDAADDDSATSGPDRERNIWPVVASVTSKGYERIPTDELELAADRIANRRRASREEQGGA